jgi:acyl dehydratase
MDVPKKFPTIVRTFSPDMVASYGRANGDRNMIHYDDVAARAAGFPRRIAHGGIAVAVVTQACRDYWGSAWFTTGRLSIRLLRPAFVGEAVTVGGEQRSAEDLDGGARVTFDIWCTNEQGEKILAGEASAILQQ